MTGEIKTKSTAFLLIAVVFAIVIVVNLISVNWFSRLDLTDNDIYSLSDVSRQLAENLNDNLTVKAYFTDDLPAPHNSDYRYLKDILDDYRSYSNGYLQYEFIDPVKEDKEQEAMTYQIPPMQFNDFNNEKIEFIKGFKGLVLIYGDKQEVLPFIENTQNLEYDLSRAINKLTQTDIPTIAFTTGHGEPTMVDRFNWANQLLQKEYRVRYLNLNELQTIPDDIDALFTVAPLDEFGDWEIYLMDQYLMRGGRLAFLIDKFEIDVEQGLILPVRNGLDSLMKFYGATVRDSVVIDAQCNQIPIGRTVNGSRMQTTVNYPFYLAVTNFNPENAITKNLNRFNILYVSPVNTEHEVGDGLRREILFRTTDNAGLRGIPVDISPEKKYLAGDFSIESQGLAVALSGHVPSYFNDKHLPRFPGADTIQELSIPEKKDFTNDARIVVVGNGSFVTDEYRQSQLSYVILFNIIDWLTQDMGLISIRSKQVGGRMLDVVSDNNKKIIKYLNMFLMPLLVIIFGLIRWQFVRARRKSKVGKNNES